MAAWRFAAVLGLALSVAACAETATLFPANDQARTLGPLKAHYTAFGVGSGPIKVAMPDGEVLAGRYSINLGGSATFGTIYATAYGAGGSASAFGNSSAFAIPNGSPGTADLIGPKGTTMQCEFYNNNWVGHGNGACRSSDGAVYRMQY